LRNSKIVNNYDEEDTVTNIQFYLRGQKKLEEVILKSSKENLDFIFTVGSSLNSAELLENERFRMMMIELKKRYDFIIIDTPPITKYTDAMIIARESDAAILVVQGNKVQRQVAEKGIEQLREANCEVLGVVFNRLEL
jgi:capsular exopolysaccharide synthesis family protein